MKIQKQTRRSVRAKEKKRLIKELDRIFSFYIRTRDGWKCVTCGSTDRESLQCGHLFSRISYNTRWDERNAYCQCSGCNFRHEHDPGPLTSYFLSLYSSREYQKLYNESHKQRHFYNYDLIKLIDYYKARLKEMGVEYDTDKNGKMESDDAAS